MRVTNKAILFIFIATVVIFDPCRVIAQDSLLFKDKILFYEKAGGVLGRISYGKNDLAVHRLELLFEQMFENVEYRIENGLLLISNINGSFWFRKARKDDRYDAL